jgi:hypothetical protein
VILRRAPSRTRGRRASVLAGLALLVAAAHARPATPPDPVAAFVARVYAPYLDRATAGGEWRDRPLFTRDLRRLIERDMDANPGEVGLLDADPLCDCQDWDGFGYTITARRRRGAQQVVAVRLVNGGERYRLALVLLPAPGGYLIDDILDDHHRPSLKLWLARELDQGPLRR